MAAGLWLYSLYLLLLLIDFPDQYKTNKCKPTNKNSICSKWNHTYHNSLENLNQFIDKYPKTFLFIYSWDNTLFKVYNTCLKHLRFGKWCPKCLKIREYRGKRVRIIVFNVMTKKFSSSPRLKWLTYVRSKFFARE